MCAGISDATDVRMVQAEARQKQKEKEEKEAAEVKALRKQMEFKV